MTAPWWLSSGWHVRDKRGCLDNNWVTRPSSRCAPRSVDLLAESKAKEMSSELKSLEKAATGGGCNDVGWAGQPTRNHRQPREAPSKMRAGLATVDSRGGCSHKSSISLAHAWLSPILYGDRFLLTKKTSRSEQEMQ